MLYKDILCTLFLRIIRSPKHQEVVKDKLKFNATALDNFESQNYLEQLPLGFVLPAGPL